jgi:hypothetical protein
MAVPVEFSKLTSADNAGFLARVVEHIGAAWVSTSGAESFICRRGEAQILVQLLEREDATSILMVSQEIARRPMHTPDSIMVRDLTHRLAQLCEAERL